jgi:hypothetical protein
VSKRIPYLTPAQYNALYEQFLEDERKDLGSSETVLGDSHYESPTKVVFESVLLMHMKVSGAVPAKAANTPESEDFLYPADKSEKYPIDNNGYASVKEFLKKVTSGSGWYEKTDLENTSKIDQMHFANTIIFLANLMLE